MGPVIEICIGTLYRKEYSVLSWKSWGWGADIRGLELMLKIDMVALCIAMRAKDEGPSRGGAEKKKHVHKTALQVLGTSGS